MNRKYYEELSTAMYPSSVLHTFGVNGKISGSIGAIGEMGGVLPIIHGPKGCGFHYQRSARRRHQPFYELLTSDLQESDIISGGEEKLRIAIRNVWNRYHPKLIMVVPTPISDILNDDIGAVVRQMREEGIPAAWIRSELFSHRDKNYSKNRIKQIANQSITGAVDPELEIRGCGYREALYAFVEQVMEPMEINPRSVNLESLGWGPGGSQILREIEDFLNSCNITVNTWVPSASFDELKQAPRAGLNITRRPRWAKQMEERFGIPYLELSSDGRYAGLDGICAFYRDVAKAMKLEVEMEPRIAAAREQALQKTEAARQELRGKSFMLLTRGISGAPFLLRQYASGFQMPIRYLAVILTPEARENLDLTQELEDKLMQRIYDAAALYSPSTQVFLNPSEDQLQRCFDSVDALVGCEDFTMENRNVPLIHIRNAAESLSFESYVRTVLRLRDRMASAQIRKDLLLAKMPFDSRFFPLYQNEGSLAAKEMWSRMWLKRKEDQE